GGTAEAGGSAGSRAPRMMGTAAPESNRATAAPAAQTRAARTPMGRRANHVAAGAGRPDLGRHQGRARGRELAVGARPSRDGAEPQRPAGVDGAALPVPHRARLPP